MENERYNRRKKIRELNDKYGKIKYLDPLDIKCSICEKWLLTGYYSRENNLYTSKNEYFCTDCGQIHICEECDQPCINFTQRNGKCKKCIEGEE